MSRRTEHFLWARTVGTSKECETKLMSSWSFRLQARGTGLCGFIASRHCLLGIGNWVEVMVAEGLGMKGDGPLKSRRRGMSWENKMEKPHSSSSKKTE